jgi:hypothetical protein
MVRVIFAGIALVLAAETAFAGDQSVRGYYRQDGTYVAPYHRTTPNKNLYDNYSSRGNLNPWTGQQGSKRNEFSNPPAYNRSSPFYTPSYPSYPSPQRAPLYNPKPYAPRRRY